MPMYNLLHHSNNYSKTSKSSLQYCNDETYDNDASDPESFKFKSDLQIVLTMQS